MAPPAPHAWVVGDARAARRRAPELERADLVVDCHRRRRGPYSGIGEALRALVPAACATHPGLVRRHDVEILTIAPELRDAVGASRETLTSLAVPRERTRYYAATRTRRLAHGIVELLNAYLRDARDGVLTLALDAVHEADPSEQELIAIALRRADPERLRLVVATADVELPAELATALRAHAARVPAPAAAIVRPDRPGRGRTARQLAAAHVDSDGTSDVAVERAAYDLLGDAERAALHDRRAAELERRADQSLRLGAIPYHLARGSDPVGRGVAALRDAVRHLMDHGLYPSAVELGEAARRLADPHDGTRHYADVSTMMTMALVAMQRPDDAERIYVELRAESSDPLVHMSACYALGMICTRHRPPERRDHEQARAYLNRAIAIAAELPRDRAFHEAFNRNGLALVEMHLGRLDVALALVNEAVESLDAELEPDEHRLHRSVLLHNRSQVNLALGRLAEAAADLERVIAADPNYPDYRFDRAALRRRLGDHDGALADYDSAIALSPPFPEAHYNRADLLAELGEHEAAVDELGYVLELEPDHLDARINRATLRYEQGDLDGAAADVEAGLHHHPADPHLLTTRGLVLMEQDRAEEAWGSFTAALDADPAMAAALSNRAILSHEAGRPERALADLTAALEAHGDDATLLCNRAHVHQELGAYDAAVADLARALELPGVDRAEALERLASLRARLAPV
ncbi:MAG: tetratricopeptide repeat protein [Frankiaceae bacterium]